MMPLDQQISVASLTVWRKGLIPRLAPLDRGKKTQTQATPTPNLPRSTPLDPCFHKLNCVPRGLIVALRRFDRLHSEASTNFQLVTYTSNRSRGAARCSKWEASKGETGLIQGRGQLEPIPSKRQGYDRYGTYGNTFQYHTGPTHRARH